MKRSELSFMDGFFITRRQNDTTPRVFDWDKAATIIKEHLEQHPDLLAEAGLQGDWKYTGGVIFRDGEPVKDDYTYLYSTWATPTLILSWDGEEQLEVECSLPYGEGEEETRFNESSKWDEISLNILNN